MSQNSNPHSNAQPEQQATSGAQPTCPKCQGSMAAGWVPETDNGIIRRVSWAAGQPTPRRIFGGVNSPPGDQSLPITAYRCTRCGFLEFYARP